MTALAQGSAGVALVMCFALLHARQINAAAILLAVQSAAVAISAIVLRQPVMAIAPLVLAGGIWFIHGHIAMLASWPRQAPDRATGGTVRQATENTMTEAWIWDIPRSAHAGFRLLEATTEPVGGAKLGIVVASVLAVLCQSQGSLALPLAVVLLAVLIAATRQHPFMHVLALAVLSNGLVLAGCLIMPNGRFVSLLLPQLACLLLPLPLAAGLMLPSLTQHRGWTANWFGWTDVAVSLIILAAALLVTLDPVATVFAPLLGLDGVVRSFRRRQRPMLSLQARGLALLATGFSILAVCTASLIGAWLAVMAATAAFVLPTLVRRWHEALAAFLGAGIALFGLLLLSAAPLTMGYFSLFAGCVLVAAAVPELAVVVLVLILRLGNQAPWPPVAETLGIGIALIALLGCALLLAAGRGKPDAASVRPSPVVLLQLSQAGIAALSICTGQADGRFAALVLMVLLILTRSAARDKAVSMWAVAGLGGVPPLGVFPGLVLAVLAIAHHDGWLLLPLGTAAIPILAAGLPKRLAAFSPAAAIPAIGWLPLILALLIGYATPEGVVRWCHAATAGH